MNPCKCVVYCILANPYTESSWASTVILQADHVPVQTSSPISQCHLAKWERAHCFTEQAQWKKLLSRFPNILHMEHRCNYQKIHIESFHFGNVQDILSWIDLWWNWASDENPDHPGRCTQTPEFWRHNRYTITVSVESTHKNWVVMPPCYNWNSSCYQ